MERTHGMNREFALRDHFWNYTEVFSGRLTTQTRQLLNLSLPRCSSAGRHPLDIRTMPILPLDYPEPFAAVLGTMLYPNEGEAAKRRAFAAQYLAEPIRRLEAAGGVLSYDDLLRIAKDAGGRLDDLDKRWWGGTAMGELFKVLFALAHHDLKRASWENSGGFLSSTRPRKEPVHGRP